MVLENNTWQWAKCCVSAPFFGGNAMNASMTSVAKQIREMTGVSSQTGSVLVALLGADIPPEMVLDEALEVKRLFLVLGEARKERDQAQTALEWAENAELHVGATTMRCIHALGQANAKVANAEQALREKEDELHQEALVRQPVFPQEFEEAYQRSPAEAAKWIQDNVDQ